MSTTVTFRRLDFEEFVELKAKIAFHAIRLSPSISAFGENIYTGSISGNGKCFLFEYHEAQIPAASFIILQAGRLVFYHHASTVSPVSIQSLIRGNITKFCLQEQGRFCLHAAAMCVGDGTVLFVGRKGAGKSTLAAFFHTRGHAVWCDDYAVLQQQDGTFYAERGETALKINPDTADSLNITAAQRRPVFELPENWPRSIPSDGLTRKTYFSLQPAASHALPRPVTAIFFIGPRSPDPPNPVIPIGKTAALAVLMDEMLLPGLNSRNYMELYFKSAADLVDNVPCYGLEAPDDVSRIHEAYHSMLEKISRSTP
ncbi:hypothetical protein [Chitinophaga rhizosphaerae]|uniref:hypothetical protein n=1 Tax=Chitinophaga rhizosphaerae TaxID=1864947 RepID=UPI000F81451B|nr:hypothetical protein [Chitinophaga rhizosphaerae]